MEVQQKILNLASGESIFFFDLLRCSFIKLRTSFGFVFAAILNISVTADKELPVKAQTFWKTNSMVIKNIWKPKTKV